MRDTSVDQVVKASLKKFSSDNDKAFKYWKKLLRSIDGSYINREESRIGFLDDLNQNISSEETKPDAKLNDTFIIPNKHNENDSQVNLNHTKTQKIYEKHRYIPRETSRQLKKLNLSKRSIDSNILGNNFKTSTPNTTNNTTVLENTLPILCKAKILDGAELEQPRYKQIRSRSSRYQKNLDAIDADQKSLYDVLQELKTVQNKPAFDRSSLHMEPLQEKTFSEHSIAFNTSDKSLVEKFVSNVFRNDSPKAARTFICNSPEELERTLKGSKIHPDSRPLHIQPGMNSHVEDHKHEDNFQVKSESFNSNCSLSDLLSNVTYEETKPATPRTANLRAFLNLKTQRNMECEKMKQASNVLRYIKSRQYSKKSREEILLAEKILLLSGESERILLENMRDPTYTEIKNNVANLATVTISNLNFPLKPLEADSKLYQYYICVLSTGSCIQMTDVSRPIEIPNYQCVSFRDVLKFKNLDSDFQINLKLYCISLGKKSKCWSLVRKKYLKARKAYPVKKYYYQNLQTSNVESEYILETGFKLCGEFQIRKSDVDQKKMCGSVEIDSRLKPIANVTTNLLNVSITSKLSGFLSFGEKEKTGSVNWNLRWCSLNHTILRIFNSPSDESYVNPIAVIDLRNSTQERISKRDKCARRYSFGLKVVEIGNLANSDEIERCYCFGAENNSEFRLWSNELNSVLSSLTDWGLLSYAQK